MEAKTKRIVRVDYERMFRDGSVGLWCEHRLVAKVNRRAANQYAIELAERLNDPTGITLASSLEEGLAQARQRVLDINMEIHKLDIKMYDQGWTKHFIDEDTGEIFAKGFERTGKYEIQYADPFEPEFYRTSYEGYVRAIRKVEVYRNVLFINSGGDLFIHY